MSYKDEIERNYEHILNEANYALEGLNKSCNIIKDHCFYLKKSRDFIDTFIKYLQATKDMQLSLNFTPRSNEEPRKECKQLWVSTRKFFNDTGICCEGYITDMKKLYPDDFITLFRKIGREPQVDFYPTIQWLAEHAGPEVSDRARKYMKLLKDKQCQSLPPQPIS